MSTQRWLLKSLFPVLLLLVGFLALFSCEDSSDAVVNHEYDSACLSCHTDSDALLALAEEEEGGGEASGEG